MDNLGKIVNALSDVVISDLIKDYVESGGEAIPLEGGGYMIDLVKFNKWRGL